MEMGRPDFRAVRCGFLDPTFLAASMRLRTQAAVRTKLLYLAERVVEHQFEAAVVVLLHLVICAIGGIL